VLPSATKHRRSRLRPRQSCTFEPLLCSKKTTTIFFVGISCSGRQNAPINKSFFLSPRFVCIHCTEEAGRRSCRKPSLCLWLAEEKVNTAEIKMDLRLGGPSNTVQRGRTQLRCQVGGCSLFTCIPGPVPVRDTFNQLCIYQFMVRHSFLCERIIAADLKCHSLKCTNGTYKAPVRTINTKWTYDIKGKDINGGSASF